MFDPRHADSRVDLALKRLAIDREELAALDPAELSGEELLDLLDRLEADAPRQVGVTSRSTSAARET